MRTVVLVLGLLFTEAFGYFDAVQEWTWGIIVVLAIAILFDALELWYKARRVL